MTGASSRSLYAAIKLRLETPATGTTAEKRMRTLTVTFTVLIALCAADFRSAFADSRGDTLARWLDVRGQEVWGELPLPCDDLTFARRVYLDVVGRVPGVSEIRDFVDLGDDRRSELINQLVFTEGQRADSYRRLSANNFARHWQRVLVPPGITTNGTPEERKFLDEFGQKFADNDFSIHRITAAICKSAWYQAATLETPDTTEVSDPAMADSFTRTLKVISPDQVFDSLEQSLLLSVSRIDPTSPRWTGSRMQIVGRLSETIGATPEDYASGIPQALMLMNGRITSDAIDLDRSRLLRAVIESPFF